ncbi:Per1-like [Lasallia pustulata]|uniref:Post-GPI attachment to proteins factor 3 n=1 Tax=Lasallia pustulata TaxID=136370 RepID=A0A1W5DA50_9LECA|nr:Per1-like [Lasallia pustulata]
MIIRKRAAGPRPLLLWSVALCSLILTVNASLGDHLPEFRECVSVCIDENCGHGNSVVPLHLRLLFWTCASNCDYVCQHIITDRRILRDPPMLEPVVQYHGKWPFHRFLGIQEPFSVLFSLFNFLAHQHGLDKVRERIPVGYPLRKYYVAFGYFGLASWVFSMVFHTRDFGVTEKLDYFAAGASVLYGLYYTPIRIFRMDQRKPPVKQTLLRLWTITCALLYVAHVSYLTLWRWDYSYNMAANVAAGIVQNVLWSWFSVTRYRKSKKPWAAWPGLIVAWIVMAMSLELLDFPPIRGMVDAHSLWHLGTVGPTIWWYNFLVKDAQQDIAGERLKA